jgi:hypothetical protein
MNQKGEVIGQRVLGLFPGIKSNPGTESLRYYRLFWTWSASYGEVIGDNLEGVLSLEDRLNKDGTNAVWKWVPEKADWKFFEHPG